jgi:2-succinyl-6-hydroxy-2,4-cyclohexadiene-1-carboxylate synthase
MRVPLLHGFAGDPGNWSAVIAAWSGAAELVPIALPGHGGGPVLPTWEANVAAIALGDAEVVVGYSLGARVALGLLATRRIARAVLIGVNAGIADEDRPARRASDAVWAKLLRTRGIAAFVDAWQAQPLFASQAQDRLAERRARRLALDPEQLARSLEVMGLAEMPDYRGSVSRCSLIAGADDAKFADIARSLPAPLELIEGSGHDPTLDQPERLAAAIARALEDVVPVRDSCA